MVIYQCRDDFNGILCGAYDAFASGLGREKVKLSLRDTGNMEMFAQYRESEETEEKLEKISRAIRRRISGEAYKWVFRASLSFEEEKADRIYRFLDCGFRLGRSVTERLDLPEVHEIFQINRFITNEAHLLTEFVRFSEMKSGVLFSRIGPKNDVVSLLAPHFADRLNSERWMIYDENRKKAAVYAPEGGWLILSLDLEEEDKEEAREEPVYESLWKTFCKSIAVNERKNYNCQRNHLPLRYRPYMTEFQEKRRV